MAENPLGELILDAMRVQRIAFRTVAARAAEAGLPLSHSAIQRMARKPLELLSRDVVTALSAGLNINEDIVLSAALDTMGMHSPRAADADGARSAAAGQRTVAAVQERPAGLVRGVRISSRANARRCSSPARLVCLHGQTGPLAWTTVRC